MKTWLIGVAAGGCLVVGFGSGLLVGRQFPAKHYERFGTSMYLYDVSTGRLCNPFPVVNDPFAAYGGHEIESSSQKDATAKPFASSNLFDKGMATSGPPLCGK